MENNSKHNQKIILGAALLLLLLLIGSCGILHGFDFFKKDNSMTVTEEQNNLPSPLVYSSVEQTDSFVGAQDGEGEITYTLIRALDEKGIYVDYFSLLNDKSTEIVVAPYTPAGRYELLIRATAAGDGDHKSSSKEFIVYITVNKANSVYDVMPTPIEGLIYNGNNMDLINPGSCSTGTIYYKVDDGEWSTSIPQAKEAGTYTVYYKVVGDRNHADIPEQSFTVTIDQATVGSKPQSQTVVYDGNRHSINYTTPAHVSKSGDASGINAGEYKATYTPEGNYVWNDGTNNPVTVTLTISRAVVNKPTNTDVVKPYTGSAQNNGYSKPDGVTMSGNDSGTKAGKYTATYTPDSNHIWNDGTTDSVTVTLTINNASVNKPTETSVVKVYNGEVQDNGYKTPEGVKMTGSNSGINAGEYEATYTLLDNYVWSDGTTDQVTVVLTINKAPVNKPRRTSVVKTYNGRSRSNNYSKPDGVTMTGKDSGVNAGEYKATYTLKDNYIWSDGSTDQITVTLTIKRAKLEVPTIAGIDRTLGIDSVEYDGDKHKAIISNYNKRLISASNTRSRRNVGEYTITLSLNNSNYEWADGTVENKEIKWSITAKKLAVPTVTKTFTYKPNTRQGVTERDLKPYNKTLMYIVSSEKHINAGEYTVTVGLRNKRNYCWILEDGTTTTENQEIPWTINKAENPIDIVKWQAVVTDYSGKEQTVAFILPSHARGEVTYEVKSAKHTGTSTTTDNISIKDNKLCLAPGTDVGIYTVVVGVHAAGDDNYLPYDGDMTVTLTVKAPNYTIKFNGNGSDRGLVVDQTIYGILKGDRLYYNQYVRDAYEFTSWNTEIDGSGESFEDEQYVTYLDLAPYEQDGVITLYAQWAPKTLKVFYELNGGSFAQKDIDENNIVYEYTVEDEPFALCYPVKRHYDFEGWSGSGLSKITKDVTVDPSKAKSNRVFTANWTGAPTDLLLIKLPDSFSDFNPLDILTNVTHKKEAVIYGEKYGDSLPAIGADVGYYGGWYTLLGKEVTKDSTATTYVDKQLYENVKALIQQFVPEEYRSYIDLADLVLNLLSVDLDNTIILIGREIPYTNISYKVNHYVETLDLNGYDLLKSETRFGSTDAKIVGEDIALNITGFSLVEQDGDDKINADGSSSVALYYDRDKYLIEFDSRGGSDIEPQEVPYDGLVTRPTEIPKYGENVFSGWYYNGKLFDFENTRIRGKITLYARWNVEGSVNVFARPFDPETGGVSGTGTYELGDEVILTAYANENYRFVEWTDGNTDNPRRFTVTQADVVAKELEFVAKFEKISARSLVNYDQVTYTAKPGDTIDVTDVFSSILLIDEFYFNGSEENPLTFDIDKSILVSRNKAYVFVDENAKDGTYSIDVTVEPFRLDLIHRKSTVKINVEVETEKFAVRFNSMGGTFVNAQYVPVGEKAVEPADPYREGYDFICWALDEEEFDFDTPITKDITLEAQWDVEGEETFEITVTSANESKYGTVSGGGDYHKGDTAIIKAVPNRGYKFLYWNNEEDQLTSSTMPITVESDAEYVAHFDVFDDGWFNYDKKYYLSAAGEDMNISDVFKKYDGGFDIVPIDPVEGNPLNVEIKEWKILWITYREAHLTVNSNAVPGQTYTIKVVPKNNRDTYMIIDVEIGYSVTFDLSPIIYVDLLNETNMIKPGSSVEKPDFEWLQKVFDRFELDYDVAQFTWYLDGALYNFDNPVTSNITLKLGWRDKYTVTFMLDDTVEYIQDEVIKGERVAEPAIPTVKGKIFLYWSLNGEAYDFSQPINNDTTLTAVWKEGITVTFDYNDKDRVTYQTIDSGEKVTAPNDTVSNGRVFEGWYLNGEAFDFDTPITENITLVAKWTEKEYQVLYDTNGGTPVSIKNNVHWNDADLTPDNDPRPILPIYVFSGWYVDELCTVPYRGQTYAELVNYNDDIEYVVLYAGWYDRSIVHYTDKFSSVAGEEAEYEIKTDDDYYLLFREYEILDASNASMFRMSKNNDKVIISKDAEPGTYYIKVSSVINTPLDYIIDDSIFDHIQTIMIEWTVVEKPIEDEEDPDAVTDGGEKSEKETDGEETPPEEGEGDGQPLDGQIVAGGNNEEPGATDNNTDGSNGDDNSGNGDDSNPKNGNDEQPNEGQENDGQNQDNNQQPTDGQGSEGQQSENNQQPTDVQQQPNSVQTQLPENPVVTGTEEPSNEEEKTDPENNMVVEGNQEPAVEGEQPEPAQGEGE